MIWEETKMSGETENTVKFWNAIIGYQKTEVEEYVSKVKTEICCDNLQHEYDRILLDVTGFKSELMKMYRKHMELLAALPTKEIVEVQDIAETQKSVILE